MKLFLVRHGETDCNVQKRYQGQSDTELNVKGIAQAWALQHRFLSEPVDAVYTSPLLRAERTARIISAERDINIVTRRDLMEISFGRLEGLSYQEILDRHPRWDAEAFDFTPYGGENMQQLAARIGTFLQAIRDEQRDNDNVLIVAHSGSLRVMLCLLLGMDINNWWRFQSDNASVSIVDNMERAPVLALLNDTSHLRV
jgi:alpha-ribazole phosphatase